MSGSPAKALELEQVAEPAVERSELLPDPRSPAAGAASGATYDKNRGEDQWPEFPGALSLATRAIQYISKLVPARPDSPRKSLTMPIVGPQHQELIALERPVARR